MASSPPARRTLDPVRSTALRWYRAFAAGGVILGSVSAWLFTIGFPEDFVPFVLALVGGWAIGLAAGGVLVCDHGWRDVGRLAIALGVTCLLLWWLGGPDAAPLRARTALSHGVVTALQFALLPLAGWLAMVAISTISSRLRSPASTPAVPEWSHTGMRSAVAFPAIPMPLRTLVIAITAIVLVLGLGIAGVLALTGDALLWAGPRFALIGCAIVLGLPAYLVLVAVLRRRQVELTVAFEEDRLTLSSPAGTRDLPYADLRELTWGGSGEYARLKVLTRGGEGISYVAGLARVAKGHAAALPALPRPVRTRLERAGLTPRSGSRSHSERGPQVFVPTR